MGTKVPVALQSTPHSGGGVKKKRKKNKKKQMKEVHVAATAASWGPSAEEAAAILGTICGKDNQVGTWGAAHHGASTDCIMSNRNRYRSMDTGKAFC